MATCDLCGSWYNEIAEEKCPDCKKPVGYPPLTPTKEKKLFVRFYDVVKKGEFYINPEEVSSIYSVPPGSAGIIGVIKMKDGTSYNLQDSAEEIVAKLERIKN